MPRSPLRIALLVSLVLVPQARAADIEGVWSFNGGQVVIEGGDGGLTGVVVRRTTLSRCPHEAGEEMERGIRLQADGSYHGAHMWLNDATCGPAGYGNAAYRVLSRPDGSRFLRLCTASPGRADLQPTIAPDGTPAGQSAPCSDSDWVAPVPKGTPALDAVATLPKMGRRRCLSRRNFRIRLREPRGDALARATVQVNGRTVVTRRSGRITAPVDLRGLPKGRYVVTIRATTVRGREITGTRRYRTCAPRRR